MKRRDIILVSLAVAGIILVILYTQGFFKKQENTFINPVLTESNNKIWTYLEKDYSGTDRISLPHNNKERDIPVFYKYCANLMSKYNTIIVTPENIHQYLSEKDLPFNNVYESQLSFKNRSDIIGAALLYKHGGLFLERGTVLMKDPKPLLQKLEIYDLITFGMARNPPGPSCCSVENMPNNQAIASRPGNPMLPLYKKKLLNYCESGNIKGGNFENPGSNALAESLVHIKKTSSSTPNIPKRPFNHFNFGANFDGTRDHHHNFVDFNLLLGKEDIVYASPNQIYFISTPTDELYRVPSWGWFLKLSEEQFNESDIYLIKTLNLKLKEL
jgi:hypothetical protein